MSQELSPKVPASILLQSLFTLFPSWFSIILVGKNFLLVSITFLILKPYISMAYVGSYNLHCVRLLYISQTFYLCLPSNNLWDWQIKLITISVTYLSLKKIYLLEFSLIWSTAYTDYFGELIVVVWKNHSRKLVSNFAGFFSYVWVTTTLLAILVKLNGVWQVLHFANAVSPFS